MEERLIPCEDHGLPDQHGTLCSGALSQPGAQKEEALQHTHRQDAFRDSNPVVKPDRGWARRAVWVILAIFVVCGVLQSWDADGDDLASSYVGCRLIATGRADHLYSYDPNDFAGIGTDSAWIAAGDEGAFDGYLHPYVQTPLWAWMLRPLCSGKFAAFEHTFTIFAMLAFAGSILLVARYWTPSLNNALSIAIIAGALWVSEPFRYSMNLVQTHVLYMLMTLAALVLAERRRPGWAGLLLAFAAAIKITPVVLVIYWAMSRRWKAAASAIGWSAAFLALAVMVGHREMSAYLQDLHRISRILLVAFNNQSLAAWWMGRFYPAEIRGFRMLPLPDAVRIGCTLLMGALTLLGGWVDRGPRVEMPERTLPALPLGAMVALIAGTLCAPISWTHYSIVLIAPLMVLWEQFRRTRQVWIALSVVLIYAFNVRPLALNMEADLPAHLYLVRSEFYSQALCLGVLLATAWWHRANLKRGSRGTAQPVAVLQPQG